MNNLIVVLVCLTLSSCVDASDYSVLTPDDAGTDTAVDASVRYCKVDSECSDGETCAWKSIATYNPNVPGGFSGECVVKP